MVAMTGNGSKQVEAAVTSGSSTPRLLTWSGQRRAIHQSLRCFGRTWAVLILRCIAMAGCPSYGQILKNNTGLTPRTLSLELHALLHEKVISRECDPGDRRQVRYRLTRRGEDAMAILDALWKYNEKYYLDLIYRDVHPSSKRGRFTRGRYPNPCDPSS